MTLTFSVAGSKGRDRWSGGTLPAVFNAANEVAVAALLDERIAFPRIWGVVAEVMARHACVADPGLDAILAADAAARTEAALLVG